MYHQTIPTSLCTHINQRHLSVFMGGQATVYFALWLMRFIIFWLHFFFYHILQYFLKPYSKLSKITGAIVEWNLFQPLSVLYTLDIEIITFFFYILLFEIKKCSIVPFPSIFSCTGNLQFNSFISFCKVQLIWCKNYHWGQSHKLL